MYNRVSIFLSTSRKSLLHRDTRSLAEVAHQASVQILVAIDESISVALLEKRGEWYVLLLVLRVVQVSTRGGEAVETT